MKLFFHFSAENFSNTYLIGPEGGGSAVLIDPGTLDVPLLELIEENNFYIQYVLLTQTQGAHVRGLKTLKKIYNADIYSRSAKVWDFPCRVVQANQKIHIARLTIDSLPFPELSQDAVAYLIGNWLFCGDVLSAGMAGMAGNSYSQANLVEALESRLYTLPDETIIYPGEGPPTLLKSEKLYNERSNPQHMVNHGTRRRRHRQ